MGKRIRTRAQREAERQDMLRAVARALMEAEPAQANHVIGKHVSAAGEQLPRIPAIGMHPGHINGTRPDHARIRVRPRRD